MQVLRWLVGASIFLALLVLSLENRELVTLKLYNLWSWEAPLVFVVLAAFALGVAAGLLSGAMRTARLKREISRMKREQTRREYARGELSRETDGLRGAAPATVVPPYGSDGRPIDRA
jgi:lipopolysaccharide assembly protein A